MVDDGPTQDPEIAAMAAVAGALKPLDEEAIRRVIRWASERFKVNGDDSDLNDRGNRKGRRREVEQEDEDEGGGDAGDEVSDNATFAEFFAASGASTDNEKALVGAYWVQYREDQPDGFGAAAVNKNLKDLGHRIENVVRAFDNLKALKPAEVVQLRKKGNARQGRKIYKVTDEGKKRVEAMVRAKGSRQAPK